MMTKIITLQRVGTHPTENLNDFFSNSIQTSQLFLSDIGNMEIIKFFSLNIAKHKISFSCKSLQSKF